MRICVHLYIYVGIPLLIFDITYEELCHLEHDMSPEHRDQVMDNAGYSKPRFFRRTAVGDKLIQLTSPKPQVHLQGWGNARCPGGTA